jgi:vacuolar-type H+-ATPase subunit F/Vma7
MPNHLAIIGDSDFISGFKSLGFILYPVDAKTDARSTFSAALKEDFLCIFILESYAAEVRDLLEEYNQAIRPMIIPLPDFRADLNFNEDLLSRLATRAIGQDITQGV